MEAKGGTRAPESLLETLRSLIERSYGMPRVIPNLAPFIVGDRGLRTLYGPEGDPPDGDGLPGARLLVREAGAVVRAALYYPDALVRHLERFHPLRGLDDTNIDDFSVLVEELDHLLLVASRAVERRPVSLLELEHHACVTKYLVVVHILGRQTRRARLPEPLRRWARFRILERYRGDGDEQDRRHREAARLAARYLARLDAMRAAERLAEIRALHRRPFSETVRLLLSLN